LLQILSKRSNSVPAWLDSHTTGHRSEHFFLTGMVIIVLAAVAGFLTNELGPEKRINILAFPLLGIIAWNLSVYAVGFVLLLRRRNQQFESGLIHSLVSLITRPVREKKESPHDLASGEKISADARIAFENQWTKFLFPLWSAKLKSFLHIAALVLAGGAIAGMYYKGLSKEYLVVWDSTFIKDGATLRPFLNMVLGPASSIFGDPLPSAAELDQLHRDPVGENAAKWIHWYAVTIAIYVLIPRAFLAGVWHFKAARTARNVPFRSASPRYFERLISISSGKSLPITVLSYAHKPGEEIRRKAHLETENLFNQPIALHWETPITFGEEEKLELGTSDEEHRIMLLFNFSATPERDTHLTLFHSLLKFQPTDRCHILLDAQAFDEKSAAFSDGDKRRDERLQAWETLFSGEDCDIHVISV